MTEADLSPIVSWLEGLIGPTEGVILADPRSVVLGDEPVRTEGRVVGRVTSGGDGCNVERSIACAYMPPEIEIGTPVEVGVFGEWVSGEVVREPLLDPSVERVRG